MPSRYVPARRRVSLAALVCLAAALAVAFVRTRDAGTSTTGAAHDAQRGGTLVAALRAEPRTFNPVIMLDNPSREVAWRLHDRLLRINRETQEIEPSLAESWSVSDDGRRFTVTLRSGLRFSDGTPCTISDVAFSLRVYLDQGVASPQRDLLLVDRQPPTFAVLDEHTIELRMAGPFAAAARLFDGLAILPRHRLEAAFDAGTLASAWDLTTPPAEIVGLGPFRLSAYEPGTRVVLERNPHYHRRDDQSRPLPWLDGMTFTFIPLDEALGLRMQAGEIHAITRLPADQSVGLESAGGPVEVRDLGAGLEYEVLVLNQNPATAGTSADARRRRTWFATRAFRQALSRAVDREAVARLAYAGRATPIWVPVSPGNRGWYHDGLERPPASPAQGRALLASVGYSWSADGRLRDPDDQPVRFTIVTNAANAARTRTAALLAQDFDQLGIEVVVRPLEFRALVQRVLTSFEYDAALMGLGGGDADPNPALQVLLSSGTTHLWHPEQHTPATSWEAQIDRLMATQVGTMDRAARIGLFHRVQQILADQMPMIPLVSPNVVVAVHRGLGGTQPAVLDDHLFWNVEQIYWASRDRQHLTR